MRLRLHQIRLAALLAVVACLFTACMSIPERATGSFVERSIDVAGTTYRYQVFVPASAAGGRTPPVILFLHGSGERGNDGAKQTQVGIGPYIRMHQDDFPAIVVFPQAPEDTEWAGNADMVFAQLDAATREFHGDPDRTYLTGLSMGGYGTWEMAMRAPGRFAALVPVCGGLVHPRRPSMGVSGLDGASDPYAAVADRLKGTPIWQFHGAKDDVVSPDYSRQMDAALKTAGAREARMTIFPDANHNSWDPAYSQTPELWPWLFAQRKHAR
jgi:predicted peptidase